MTALPHPGRPRARFQVTIVVGSTRETRTLDEGVSWLIGRSSDCAIQLDDPSVSRHHAQLHPTADRVELEDLGSANGTWVLRAPSAPSAVGVVGSPSAAGAAHGERRVEPHVRTSLRIGETVRVGEARILLDWVTNGSVSHARLSALPELPVVVDAAMRGVHELALRAARRDIPVLILGETGVGKGLIAQAVHRASPRASAPFGILNCAALPEALLERELFGYEPALPGDAAGNATPDSHASGAPGGVAPSNSTAPARAGLLEETHGGTLFLDEIGELPLRIQPKLLRVLEEREVSRVGSKQPRAVDVRVVAATNRDLLAEVRAGRFRGDLYYRISGLSIRVPPLRERPSEIEPLARHFLRRFASAENEPAPELTRAAIETLERHSWPGNVRELRNVIERAALIAGDSVIDAAQIMLDGPPERDDESTSWDGPTRVLGARESEPPGVEPVERERLIAALDACAGNQRRAAELLGISRRTLVNRLNKWKLPRPRKKEPPLEA